MENEAEFDDIEYVSKSQLKRESHALQDLGKRLVALSDEHLTAIPLDDSLREAIQLARKIHNKRSALKRQYQFIGKLLRSCDSEPIYAALQALDHQSQQSIKKHHRAEHWRDRIVDQGENAIDALLEEIPTADRQKLRQLWRNRHNAKTDTKKTQQSRLIYKEIKSTLDS